jgi:hypothetical protein
MKNSICIVSLTVITVLFLVAGATAVWGEATYFSTGKIHLYPVDVAGDGLYEAYLNETDSTGQAFVLESINSVISGEPAVATFDGATGKLHIPKLVLYGVGITTKYAEVDMELVPGSDPMIFQVTRVIGLYLGDDRGPQGPKGAKGDAGIQGLKGDTGDKGDKGDTGLQGLKGDPGVPGTPGTPGAPGLKGDKGDTGDKGDKGDTGDTGAPGPSGVSGYEIVTSGNTCGPLSTCKTSLSCPAGKTVISGGAAQPTGYSALAKPTLMATYPDSNTSWAVVYNNPALLLTISYTMYAVCVTVD